jgi:phospholipase C
MVSRGTAGSQTRILAASRSPPPATLPTPSPPSTVSSPFHNLPDVNQQIFGTRDPATDAHPRMNGFVANYREALDQDTRGNFTATDVAVVMQSFNPGALPAITALADHFLLCDAWFSEVPGPTHPNRLYMHAGTSQGFVHNVDIRIVAAQRPDLGDL